MRRTQIYLDEALAQQVQSTAAAEGRSAAALIRDAVRRYLSAEQPRMSDPILASIGSVTGLPPDSAETHDRDLYGAPDR